MKIVTTSWDDGQQQDYKVLKLLAKYRLKGTFYIQKNLWDKESSHKLIKEIASKYEVGAHTLNHVWLNQLSGVKQKEEIIGSKRYLEEIIQRSVGMFCYPGGYVTKIAKEMVKKAGFLGARTTDLFVTTNPADPYTWGTTQQVYPHPFVFKGIKSIFSENFSRPIKKNMIGIKKLGLPFRARFNWLSLTKSLFDYVDRHDGIFHLWGHSWEIEKYNMWSKLEKIFKYISLRQDFEYLTNSQTLKRIR